MTKNNLNKKEFYTISEVASIFSLETSTIRFWEKEFSEISPKKDAKGNRFYTNKDVQTIKIIYNLVKEKGFKLEGAKKMIREEKTRIDNKNKLLSKLTLIKEEITKLKKILS